MQVNNRADLPEKTKLLPRRIVHADGTVENAFGSVVWEHFLDVIVNEKLTARLVCTPSDLVELVLGRLLTEGIISCGEEVESIYLCETAGTAKVFLKEDVKLRPPENVTEATCCTGNRMLLQKEVKDGTGRLRKLERVEWKPEWIFALADAFAEDSRLHRETKGTHSCYLSMGGKVLFSAEDIGRHNALDKCIGHALLKGLPLRDCILFTTGRVPTDMVQKAVAAGIPILVSKAVPTQAAVMMAEKYHLTLICQAWPDSYAVYHEAKMQQ